MFSYLDFSEFLFADNFVLGRTKIQQARIAFIKFIINRFDAFPITPQIRIVNACKITCSKACSKVSANSSNDASTDIIHHRLKQVSNIKSGLSADIVGSRDTRANIVSRQCRLTKMTANIVGRQCWLVCRRLSPDSRQQIILKRKRILVITSFLVRYKNEETPQNFSKETTLATTIDTWDIFFVGYDCIDMLTSKNRAKNGSRWTRDWIARRTTINVGNFTTKCHSFLEKTAKNNK